MGFGVAPLFNASIVVVEYPILALAAEILVITVLISLHKAGDPCDKAIKKIPFLFFYFKDLKNYI
jgi:hypothetical protein